MWGDKMAKGFLLDENNDIVTRDGKFVMINDNKLTGQTLRTILGTAKGEWFRNANEGIDQAFMIGKGVTEDMQRTQIEEACLQVDGNLHVSEFHSETDKKTRVATITFTATDANDNEITVETQYE